MYTLHHNNPQTSGELKAAITAKIKEIPQRGMRVLSTFSATYAYNATEPICSKFLQSDQLILYRLMLEVQ